MWFGSGRPRLLWKRFMPLLRLTRTRCVSATLLLHLCKGTLAAHTLKANKSSQILVSMVHACGGACQGRNSSKERWRGKFVVKEREIKWQDKRHGRVIVYSHMCWAHFMRPDIPGKCKVSVSHRRMSEFVVFNTHCRGSNPHPIPRWQGWIVVMHHSKKIKSLAQQKVDLCVRATLPLQLLVHLRMILA